MNIDDLRDARQELVFDLEDALDEIAAQREAYFDGRRPGNYPSFNSSLVADRRAALAAFDAAHPEVLQAERAERAKSVERHVWD
jgi:hypothetical protein